MIAYKKIINDFLKIVVRGIRSYYGDRLVSIVVFGSVARGVPRPDSDIDILIVAENLPCGRLKRVFEFQNNIENILEERIKDMHKKGIYIELSPVFKGREEVEFGSPLFLDMTHDVILLYDRDGFFDGYLGRLKKRLNKLGSKRISKGNAWYWLLKPDYKYGDIIEL